MFRTILAQAVNPAQRLNAVHEHFMQRSTSDGMRVIFVTLVVAVGLCAVLLLMGRFERARQLREEKAQAQRRHRMARPSLLAAEKNRQFTLLGKK